MSAPFELLQRVGVHGAFDRLIGRRPGVEGAAAFGLVDQLRGRPTGAAIETLGAAARAVRKANHPGLQQVVGAGRAEGTAYVMSELVAGERLGLLVTRGRSAGWPTVPIHVAADLVAEVAMAVGALHGAGRAHGRLDPDHVVVEYRGRVRVVDVVTVAVEARLEGDRITPADDVHALAELFEYLIRGGRLGLGRAEMGPYEGVVAQALAVDPAMRPAGGAAFAKALRAAGTPVRSAATMAGWVRDACPDRAAAWRDVLQALKGAPDGRALKRLARLMAPAAVEAPQAAQPPSFERAPAPAVSRPAPGGLPPPRVTTPPEPRIALSAPAAPLPAPTSTGELPIPLGPAAGGLPSVQSTGELPILSTGDILVPPRVLRPTPAPGEDEPTTEVRSPARRERMLAELEAAQGAASPGDDTAVDEGEIDPVSPAPRAPDTDAGSHEATAHFVAPRRSEPSGGESTAEALFPIAAVTPAPELAEPLPPTEGLRVPPDGFEPDIDRDDPADAPRPPVVTSVEALLGGRGPGRPSGDPHSAMVVEVAAVTHGVVTESVVLHRGQSHPLVRHRGERIELTPPKDAEGQHLHLGDRTSLVPGGARPIELGDRAEITWRGARWTVRVDHAAVAPGRATGRRKPWGVWLTAIGGGLALHLLFVAGVVSLDAIGVQLTVDEPVEKERWARLETKALPDKPKPKVIARPKPKPKPRPKPVVRPPAPSEAPADPAEARPTVPDTLRRKVRDRVRAARTRAKDDAEALLNAVNADPGVPGRDGATLEDVVSTIDAVGKANGTAALEVPGTLGALPGGGVNIGRERARLSPGGGRQIGRDVGRVGKKRSKGGAVRGKVRNLSSRTKVASCDVSKSAVRGAVERNQGRIVGCYEKALLKRADLSGKVTVEWRISANGKPTGTKIKVSTLGDPAVAQCVLGIIRKTRFPAPKSGECIISYPFIFSPSQ